MNEESSIVRPDDELSDDELAVHRFLDNELTPQERLAFLERLDREPHLRQRVVAFQRLAVMAAELSRPPLPASVRASILDALPAKSKPWCERIREWLMTPHVWRWNPAMALTALCALGVAWLLLIPGKQSDKETAMPDPQPVHLVNAPTDTPSERDVLVRLVLVEPRARSVAVAGDFNDWMPERTPLEQVRDGVWTTVVRVKPGRYHYMFVVDGKLWVADPLAPEYSLDGFGSKNAVLDVEMVM